MKGEFVYPRIRIFRVKESLGTQNYASISYCEGNKLSIKFTMNNTYYDIVIGGIDNYGDFKTLNVHHQYYIKGHNAWEYDDDDALITLCTECHSFKHKSIKTLSLYNDVKELLKEN